MHSLVKRTSSEQGSVPVATGTPGRYHDGVRAELIDGKLWDLASPSRKHQKIVFSVARSLANFIEAHQGSCEVYPAPFAVNLFADESTFVEPDISVVCDSSKLSDRGCEGAPDLVVEVVSPSNPGMDYISKLNRYHEALGNDVRVYSLVAPTSVSYYLPKKYSDLSGNAVFTPKKMNEIFTNPSGGDYSLKEDSPVFSAIPDFEPLPLEEIGRR